MSALVFYAKIPILHSFEIVYLDKIKHMRMKNFTYLILSLLLFPVLGQSQSDLKRDIAIKYVQDNAEELGLKAADVADMQVTDVVHYKHNGAYSVYLNQTFEGIPIEGATFNINIRKNDEVGFNRNQYLRNVKSRVKHTEATVSPEEALNATAKELYVALTKRSNQVEKKSDIHYVYEGVNLSMDEIPVKLKYIQDENGDLILSWKSFVMMKDNPNTWNVYVDARSGKAISKKNMTHYCSLANMDFSRPAEYEAATKAHNCADHNHAAVKTESENAAVVSGTYRAYALPAESPNHGPHEMVVNPHYPEASPFGWHDVDGQDGADFTITRGNNCNAFVDNDGDGNADGNEPDGGAALVFDFPHETDMEGDFNFAPAVVNLFYTNSIAHDILALYGFDEANGNFQQRNYTGQGAGNDPITAREAVPDPTAGGPIWNNASFGAGADGSAAVMSMGIWQSNTSIFEVESPDQIAGPYEVLGHGADWGFSWDFDEVDLRGIEVALARDATIQSPTQCCEEIVNGDEIAGKFAVIDRGLCEFGLKVFNAQEQGAIGVIICNLEGVNGGTGEELVNMAPGADGINVTIPSVFAGKSTCDRIKAAIGGGNTVTATMSTMIATGPQTFNSAFDNGVIFHEYGHGFNGRFLGGPNSTGGLNNAEQMGEGWSDFFSISFTVKEGDTGATPRGVGSYLLGQAPTGGGIRAFPYSTDFDTSPYTYDDIIGKNEVHAIGEIWTAVLWDVFWFFIDTYGYDADWANQDSGNGRGMRLIMDGVGLVGASPGFVDARDALLESDEINFGGMHNCELWNIFARRGLGFFADQGNPNDSNDGVENFEPRPTCIEELKVRRSIGDLVLPGEEVNVALDIWNHTLETQTNVLVTDMIQDGLTYVAGSSSGVEPTVNGNMLVFDMGDMVSLQEERITYMLRADADNKSESLVYDSVEGVAGSWDVNFIEGFNIFNTTSTEANSPTFSWLVESPDEASEQELYYEDLVVDGENPALRFYTKINTVLGNDGGFIDISSDGGVTWFRPDNDYIQGGPSVELGYTTFAIPALPSFSGIQTDWVPSYIDLEAYKGETITVRWRFGTDDSATDQTPLNADATDVSFAAGWYIDDLELLDLKKYETNACVVSDQTDEVCTMALTTIVDALLPTSVQDLAEEGYTMQLAPNPADDVVNIQIGSVLNERAILELKTIDGKVITTNLIDVTQEGTNVNLDLNGISSGLYFVTLQSRNKVLTKKLMIK